MICVGGHIVIDARGRWVYGWCQHLTVYATREDALQAADARALHAGPALATPLRTAAVAVRCCGTDGGIDAGATDDAGAET